MPISIVMPTYNRRPLLEQAVQSVLGQTYGDWELLISDDGSTDDTHEYLASLKDPRIQYFLQREKVGQFGNFNFLIARASHEIVQILCDDDYFAGPDSLAKLMDLWKGFGPEVGFLRENHDISHAGCSLTRFEREVLPERIEASESDLFFLVFGCIPGNISNVSLRTEAFRETDGFRTDYKCAGDFEFWSRLGRRRPWCITQAEITLERKHGGQNQQRNNRFGQCVAEYRAIYTDLYRNLVSNGARSSLLRLMYMVSPASVQRDKGIQIALRTRDVRYLRSVMREMDHSDASGGRLLGWMIYFASGGGRFFRVQVARRLLAQSRHA